jgi:hypothetical protein
MAQDDAETAVVNDEFARSLLLLLQHYDLPLPVSCAVFGADGRGLVVRLEISPDPARGDVQVRVQAFGVGGTKP